MVYVYLASFVGFFASVISMAEISSMYVFGHADFKSGVGLDLMTSYLAPQPPEVNITGLANSQLRAGKGF